MLKDEEVKAVIAKEDLSVGEALEVITRYIYDKKEQTVEINPPATPNDEFLMSIAYRSAVEYYKNKFMV